MNPNFKLRIIRVMALALFSTAIATMSGCGLFGEDDPCGRDRGEEATFFVFNAPNSVIRGGDRVFIFNILGFRNNVCPDKHVFAEAVVVVSEQPLKRITAKLVVHWGGLAGTGFELQFPVENSMPAIGIPGFVQLSGSTPKDGVGLKQAFGDDPASYNALVEISFNTFGDKAQDVQFVKDNIESVTITTTYNEFKGGSSANNPLASP